MTRPATSLPFVCLITRIHKVVAIPILVGIVEETVVTKKIDIERIKYESRLEMQVHKLDTRVFRPIE